VEISNNLINTLTDVADILNNLQIKYCLVGGLAVSMLSKPRATEDVDFLILLEHGQQEELVYELKKKFDIIQNKKPIQFKNITIWRLVVKEKDSVDYDFTVLDFLFGENKIYNNALDNSINIIINNTKIKVANIKSLIEMKRISGRRIDLIDIEELTKEFGKN
jgi:hypothetical protein